MNPAVLALCDDLETLSKKKKKERLILFFGRDSFCDNTKYLFLHMLERYPDYRIFWCSGNATLVDSLKRQGIPAFNIAADPKFTYQIFLEATLSVFCVNPLESVNGNMMMLACLAGSLTIQLWHGIGVKKIDLGTTAQRDLESLQVTKTLIGATQADYYLSPSAFVDDKWHEFFGARQLIRAGYPRNEVLLRDSKPRELLGAELTPPVQRALYRSPQRKILLAPTWVENIGLNHQAVQTAILQFCQQHDIQVFIKKHPFAKGKPLTLKAPNLFVIDPSVDIYPHMKAFAAMVTDYSSIVFDYLLLDRPILTVDTDNGPDFNYANSPDQGAFRYSVTHDNIAEMFGEALFRDSKSEARKALCKFIFDSDNHNTCELLATKIMALNEQKQLERHRLTIV